MRKSDFWLVYFLLLLAQLLISNYMNITPYVTLSILPVMVLCISLRYNTVAVMFIAMATGLSVDLLSEGVIGLNALALVPVAFVRKSLIKAFFGNGLLARKEDFTLKRNGFLQAALLVFIVHAIFLVFYIWADGAGLRPLWFNAARYGASLLSGFLLSLLTLDALAR